MHHLKIGKLQSLKIRNTLQYVNMTQFG